MNADPYTLAIMICGAAQIQAYTEHIGGPDALRGSRRECVTAVVDALAF